MRYQFEDLVLDTDRRELIRGAAAIPAGPQVFDLLVYLVQHRDRVVTKDDLLQAVWQGRIVSESTLTSHVNAARKAIGDNGVEQRLIRTVARKGLRFVGEVNEAAAVTASSTGRLTQVSEAAGHEPPLADRPSIAVLAFQNLSGDPEQEYFADGVVEDLKRKLGRVDSLWCRF